MRKIVKAQVAWLTYKEGGRKNSPPMWTRYCPIVIFNGMSSKCNESWSADFICTDIDDNHKSIVNFTFLAEDDPFGYLTKGNEFELFEGSKKIAVGSILE